MPKNLIERMEIIIPDSVRDEEAAHLPDTDLVNKLWELTEDIDNPQLEDE